VEFIAAAEWLNASLVMATSRGRPLDAPPGGPVNRSSKVKATRQLQQGSATKQVKAGKAYNGANYVAQKDASAKKGAAKTAASRKAGKK